MPSTMYNDYAKIVSLTNPKAQQELIPRRDKDINDRSPGHKVLLFKPGSLGSNIAMPSHIFLGNARYVSHKGSNPMAIVWKMDHEIPERIIRQSNLRVVN